MIHDHADEGIPTTITFDSFQPENALVGEPDCFVNHACEPSAYKRYTESGVDMVAIRDIGAGEEITYD